MPPSTVDVESRHSSLLGKRPRRPAQRTSRRSGANGRPRGRQRPHSILLQRRACEEQQLPHGGRDRDLERLSRLSEPAVWSRFQQTATTAAVSSVLPATIRPLRIIFRPRMASEPRFIGATPAGAMTSTALVPPSSVVSDSCVAGAVDIDPGDVDALGMQLARHRLREAALRELAHRELAHRAKPLRRPRRRRRGSCPARGPDRAAAGGPRRARRGTRRGRSPRARGARRPGRDRRAGRATAPRGRRS